MVLADNIGQKGLLDTYTLYKDGEGAKNKVMSLLFGNYLLVLTGKWYRTG